MRKLFSLLGFLAIAVAMMVPIAAYAQSSVDVRFPRGSSGTTINGTIRGDQAVSYRLGVSAGQVMSIQLDTGNASNYFNVGAPGASEALYNSSINGNSTSFVVPSSGTYAISVYLMRNAARRGETANYQLTISVENGSGQVQRPVTLPAPPVVPNYADGLDGGPDLWRVEGLAGGDTLNVRSGPATNFGVIATVRNGDVLRNFGCTMTGSTRWCQIETPRGQRGWVAGRYLHESFGQPTTLPAPAPRPTPLPTPVPTATISVDEMSRFCVGEASARLGVRPQYLTAGPAFEVRNNNYGVYGNVTRDGATSIFSCTFNSAGDLLNFTGN